jgi:hypothetical protein
MEFKNLTEELNFIVERTLGDIVDQWEGLRKVYSSNLKAKGEAAANQAAKKWLGDMEAVGSVKEIANKLAAKGKTLDKLDQALVKVINAYLSEKAKGQEEVTAQRKAAAQKAAEYRGAQMVYPGVKYGS